MGTVVITGGTDGIGRYLADHYIAQGDTVVVIGRDRAKGESFEARSDSRGVFVRADLDSISENLGAIDRLTETYHTIDALVLCARFYRSYRTETVDGIESTFAHFYLSRYLFSHRLRESLERSRAPVIVNVAGPGSPLATATFDDLQSRVSYHGGRALGQGGKLNDLLGVSFAEQYRETPIRYILVHPGVTATAQRGNYDAATSVMVDHIRQSAKPVAAAAEPIISLIANPPPDRLSAYVEGQPIPVLTHDFDPAAARALDRYTEAVIDGVLRTRGGHQ